MKNHLMKNCIIFSQLNFKKIAAKGLILISVFVFLSCEKTDPSVDYADIVSGNFEVRRLTSQNGEEVRLPAQGVSGKVSVSRLSESTVSVAFTWVGVPLNPPASTVSLRGGDNADEINLFSNGTYAGTYFRDDKTLVIRVSTVDGYATVSALK